MYVYSTAGEAVGFVFGSFIYDLGGRPLGRLLGSRIHRIDGSYAGEWFHNMVVDKRNASPRPISPMAEPPPRPPVDPCSPRRPVAEHFKYPDAFARLYGAEPIAAE